MALRFSPLKVTTLLCLFWPLLLVACSGLRCTTPCSMMERAHLSLTRLTSWTAVRERSGLTEDVSIERSSVLWRFAAKAIWVTVKKIKSDSIVYAAQSSGFRAMIFWMTSPLFPRLTHSFREQGDGPIHAMTRVCHASIKIRDVRHVLVIIVLSVLFPGLYVSTNRRPVDTKPAAYASLHFASGPQLPSLLHTALCSYKNPAKTTVILCQSS